jgi:hypothetical protein
MSRWKALRVIRRCIALARVSLYVAPEAGKDDCARSLPIVDRHKHARYASLALSRLRRIASATPLSVNAIAAIDGHVNQHGPAVCFQRSKVRVLDQQARRLHSADRMGRR